MASKQELRKTIKDTLRHLDKITLENWSTQITEQVTSLPEWKNASTIGITISGSYEVNTEQLIQSAWETNKKIVVPKCHPSTKTMTFREITSFDQLEVVYYGLKEPIEEKTIPVEHIDIDLLIVPGLCFTEKGYRLGHGGGYYDRYLSTYKGRTLSLAFPVQLVNALPIEAFDIPVQKLATTTKVIQCDE